MADQKAKEMEPVETIEISQMFLIGSLSGIAVLGDIIRNYLPLNLILLLVIINLGITLSRIFFRRNLKRCKYIVIITKNGSCVEKTVCGK